MTKESGPLAWRAQPPPQLSAALLRELDNFRAGGLGEARRQRVWQSLERELSAKPVRLLRAKTAGVLGVSVVALVLVAQLLGQPARHTRPVVSAAPSLPPVAAVVAEYKAHEDSPPAAAAAPPAQSALLPSRQRASLVKSRSQARGTSASELQLLLRARRLIRSAPAQALELAEQHRSSYPQGLLSEEREVLAIDALERSGRHAQALERARLSMEWLRSRRMCQRMGRVRIRRRRRGAVRRRSDQMHHAEPHCSAHERCLGDPRSRSRRGRTHVE